jgi:hypothetical protein
MSRMSQEQQPPVFRSKQEYRKATLRMYGTVGELTNTVGTKGKNDGGKKGKDMTRV